MKLKDRLTIALTLVTGAVLGVSFFVVAVLVRQDETEDLDRAILSQATTSMFLVLQKDRLHPKVIDGAGEVPELSMPVRRYEAIYGPDGQVLSATHSFDHQTPSLEQLGVPPLVPREGVIVELEVQGNKLRGLVLPFGEQLRYRMLYALTRRSVDDDLRFLHEVFSVLFLASLAATTVLSRWLGARLASDVDTLARVARAVTSGDLAARVHGRTQGGAELKALGDDMDRMIGQLGELVANQRTFVSHAAHELRSPLATLRGQLQLALRRPRPAEEYREIIEESLVEVESLIALAEDLLVLARLQGSLTPRENQVTLEESIRDALRMARGAADQRDVLFREDFDAIRSLPVQGNRADLARALRNLLDNAVAHSPPGGTVRLEGLRRQDRLELAVIDQGAGIPSQDVPRLFSPFFRGSKEQSGESQGTGLGLTIVREIVRSHGGEIFLDTAHAQGARFVLTLPLAQPSAEHPEKAGGRRLQA